MQGKSYLALTHFLALFFSTFAGNSVADSTQERDTVCAISSPDRGDIIFQCREQSEDLLNVSLVGEDISLDIYRVVMQGQQNVFSAVVRNEETGEERILANLLRNFNQENCLVSTEGSSICVLTPERAWSNRSQFVFPTDEAAGAWAGQSEAAQYQIVWEREAKSYWESLGIAFNAIGFFDGRIELIEADEPTNTEPNPEEPGIDYGLAPLWGQAPGRLSLSVALDVARSAEQPNILEAAALIFLPQEVGILRSLAISGGGEWREPTRETVINWPEVSRDVREVVVTQNAIRFSIWRGLDRDSINCLIDKHLTDFSAAAALATQTARSVEDLGQTGYEALVITSAYPNDARCQFVYPSLTLVGRILAPGHRFLGETLVPFDLSDLSPVSPSILLQMVSQEGSQAEVEQASLVASGPPELPMDRRAAIDYMWKAVYECRDLANSRCVEVCRAQARAASLLEEGAGSDEVESILSLCVQAIPID